MAPAAARVLNSVINLRKCHLRRRRFEPRQEQDSPPLADPASDAEGRAFSLPGKMFDCAPVLDGRGLGGFEELSVLLADLTIEGARQARTWPAA